MLDGEAGKVGKRKLAMFSLQMSKWEVTMSTIGRLLYAMRHQSFMQVWLVVVLLGSWVRPSLAQEALDKAFSRARGVDLHACERLAGRRPGLLQKAWSRCDLCFYRQRISDVAGINRRRSQSGFHQRRSHGGRRRGGSRSHDRGGDYPYNALSILGSTPGAPAGGSERKKSRHQHLWLRQSSGG